jgi:transposase-like protein
MHEFPPSLFRGRHFDRTIIVLRVRWYITYKLSYRDLVQMMAERGIRLSHMTILRWVQHYIPEFEKRWHHYDRGVGPSWQVDETYIKVRGGRFTCLAPLINKGSPLISC